MKFILRQADDFLGFVGTMLAYTTIAFSVGSAITLGTLSIWVGVSICVGILVAGMGVTELFWRISVWLKGGVVGFDGNYVELADPSSHSVSRALVSILGDLLCLGSLGVWHASLVIVMDFQYGYGWRDDWLPWLWLPFFGALLLGGVVGFWMPFVKLWRSILRA